MSDSLPVDDFKNLVSHAPLIAIDLLVHNVDNHLLLGLRRNPPARNFWFVPGGRIRRFETLDQAFSRLTCSELGFSYPRSSAHFYGIYEHFYDDDFLGDESHGGTHYVVLAYRINLSNSLDDSLPLDQHLNYRWLCCKEVLSDPLVHVNTKAYCVAENQKSWIQPVKAKASHKRC